MEKTKLNPPLYRLRRTIKWIGRHPLITLLMLSGFIGAGVYLNKRIRETRGVLSEPVHKGNITEAVYGIGTVMANRSFKIKPGVTSTLTNIYVKEGDQVDKGQKLVDVDNITIRAPFSGTITSLPYKIGENIFSAIPVLTLVNLKDRYLVVSLEQQGALRVKPGQAARISFDTIRNETYHGVVESAYSNEGSFLARIEVKDLPSNILPSMTADVAITIHESKDALLAPVAALEEGKYVWIKRGRMPATKQEVSVGIVDGPVFEIRGGDLHDGDRALIRSQVNH